MKNKGKINENKTDKHINLSFLNYIILFSSIILIFYLYFTNRLVTIFFLLLLLLFGNGVVALCTAQGELIFLIGGGLRRQKPVVGLLAGGDFGAVSLFVGRSFAAFF